MKRAVNAGKTRIEYTLIQSANRQDVLLQALPEGRVRVYAPKHARLREIDKVVADKADWLIETQRKIDQSLPEHARIEDGAETLLEGAPARLCVRPAAINRIRRVGDALEIQAADLSQDALREQLKRWMCRLALDRIRERLDEYAPGIGVPYGRVTIREQRTRWGSCSSRHNLNFNWKLIRAPEAVLTYVVIHELCHLKDFNHSPRFWDEVKKRQPDFEVWKKWLKRHGRELDL